MKKLTALVLAISCFSTASLASPSFIVVDITCPATSGSGVHRLSNFGTFIAGYGTKKIDTHPSNDPYFIYNISVGTQIPHSLTSYSNNGTNYDETTGNITCSYISNQAPCDPFTVTYHLINATSGQLISQTANSVKLLLLLGLDY